MDGSQYIIPETITGDYGGAHICTEADPCANAPSAVDVEIDENGMVSAICPHCGDWVVAHPSFRYASHTTRPLSQGSIHTDDMPNSGDPGQYMEVESAETHVFLIPV